jgi:hypothetical protein
VIFWSVVRFYEYIHAFPFFFFPGLVRDWMWEIGLGKQAL